MLFIISCEITLQITRPMLAFYIKTSEDIKTKRKCTLQGYYIIQNNMVVEGGGGGAGRKIKNLILRGEKGKKQG